MELQTVETFLKAAANQNLSHTAQMLGYSQSAVTAQIQKLERELGVQLFERIGKRIFLTQQGAAFLPYASNLIKAAEAARTFSQGESKPRGTLRIGGVESISTALLPTLLPDFYRCCPEVEVVVRSGSTTDMLELLGSNDLDVVLTLDTKLSFSALICEAIEPEEIIFVTRFDGATPGIIAADDLCQKPFILTEHQASYRYELERLLAERDLSVRPILEIGNTETIINLLKKGMGMSLLPRFTVEQELLSGELVEVSTDLAPICMHKQLLRHRGKWITPQLRIFTQLVRENFGIL